MRRVVDFVDTKASLIKIDEVTSQCKEQGLVLPVPAGCIGHMGADGHTDEHRLSANRQSHRPRTHTYHPFRCVAVEARLGRTVATLACSSVSTERGGRGVEALTSMIILRGALRGGSGGSLLRSSSDLCRHA